MILFIEQNNISTIHVFLGFKIRQEKLKIHRDAEIQQLTKIPHITSKTKKKTEKSQVSLVYNWLKQE